ncbi:hypothetical protein G7K_0148-t1 [Saitoella complicata NRRL Y-17804]|uniref:Ribosomal eL28/Mak16 domain-containing protein n=1 Tax=Saitoella complicata (strain BCRC 22490 / CBS 7301 / JCM 7358 / NBRC 10748 / NRRL Y-17804) TaxID=698492 RepID=A0A0E9N7M5_SAICN|nr:hypothetical protein G7K_0148-t1 [Saitoella complicata NRRL Y-17804]
MSAPSADLCWEVVRDQSSYLVKRPNLAPMSRDPFALTNFHSYKYSGVNDKAVAVQVAPSGKEGLQVSRSPPRSPSTLVSPLRTSRLSSSTRTSLPAPPTRPLPPLPPPVATVPTSVRPPLPVLPPSSFPSAPRRLLLFPSPVARLSVLKCVSLIYVDI